jgi:hypothetical protein
LSDQQTNKHRKAIFAAPLAHVRAWFGLPEGVILVSEKEGDTELKGAESNPLTKGHGDVHHRHLGQWIEALGQPPADDQRYSHKPGHAEGGSIKIEKRVVSSVGHGERCSHGLRGVVYA